MLKLCNNYKGILAPIRRITYYLHLPGPSSALREKKGVSKFKMEAIITLIDVDHYPVPISVGNVMRESEKWSDIIFEQKNVKKQHSYGGGSGAAAQLEHAK